MANGMKNKKLSKSMRISFIAGNLCKEHTQNLDHNKHHKLNKSIIECKIKFSHTSSVLALKTSFSPIGIPNDINNCHARAKISPFFSY
jgi:hypothetical protein